MVLVPDTPEYKKAQKQYLKATRNRPVNIDQDWTPFRAAEKRYKARFPPPDLSGVLDLGVLDERRQREIAESGWKGRSNLAETIKLKTKDGLDAYTVPKIPGLVILPNFLSQRKQRNLIRWSLARHARHPNETNLDTHYILPQEGLWNAYLAACEDSSKDFDVQPRASASASPASEQPGPRQLINNVPASPSTFSVLSDIPKLPAPPSTTLLPTPVSSLVSKLRWANIGWYYHWGSKQYDFSRRKVEVDTEIRNVCREAVGCIKWDDVFGSGGGEPRDGWGDDNWRTWDETYEPDAGIVNFYQEKDTLMAHADRSELNSTSPLVSISLGLSSVFLIGGPTRDTEPVPILLRSGDVVIMSGPGCRRAYHGIPRVLEGSMPWFLQKSEFDDLDVDGDKEKAGEVDDWASYQEYMRTTRINVNVRQVFPKGFDPYTLSQTSAS
ncbi:hypothetical protein CPB83DRAFT_867295 [Crepidotus variabilis]|uniref:Fe2OG dioxygenase domain-containing protein n=1 Tax=Crepidotus variabilis TaxID=179855 RepID=A0A9P6JUJ4_9AGAR|nr:hypothetical protein CPB83DRAFT_867295 [Crepidotus variabilis]